MAFSPADIAAIDAAIGTGALEVQYADGRKVTYRSLRDMREIRRMMQQDAAPSVDGPPSRSFVAGF